MKTYTRIEIELTEADLRKAVEAYCKAQFRDFDIGELFSSDLTRNARVIFKKNGVEG